jgi:hypothetical protein
MFSACTSTAPAGTAAAEVVPAAGPEPTLTASPTGTPSPTATATPVVLAPAGPYVLFEGEGGVWLANPDGSALTRISDEGLGGADAHAALSPDGRSLAYISWADSGPILKLLSLPGGEVKTIAQLLTITYEEQIDTSFGSKAFIYMALERYANLAWSPDGRLLAFIGAMDGPSADLYTYDMGTGEIRQLTSGASQAIAPSWSSDGSYILHFGVSWVPPFGGAIVGYNHMDGTWAVRVEDGTVFSLPKVESHYNLIGWSDATHYLAFDSPLECAAQSIRSVDVTSGQSSTLFRGCIQYQVQQSQAGTVMFSGTDSCPSCQPGVGVFLLQPGMDEPVRVAQETAYEFSWLPEDGVFYAYPVGLFSEDGREISRQPVQDHSRLPAVSRAGFVAWVVVENRQGRVVLSEDGKTYRTIFDPAAVAAMIWDPLAGDALLIATADGGLHRASAPNFTPELIGTFDGAVSQAIWVP